MCFDSTWVFDGNSLVFAFIGWPSRPGKTGNLKLSAEFRDLKCARENFREFSFKANVAGAFSTVSINPVNVGYEK